MRAEIWQDDHPELGEPQVTVCRDSFDVEQERMRFERDHRRERKRYSFRTYKRDVRLRGARIYLFFVVIRKRPA